MMLPLWCLFPNGAQSLKAQGQSAEITMWKTGIWSLTLHFLSFVWNKPQLGDVMLSPLLQDPLCLFTGWPFCRQSGRKSQQQLKAESGLQNWLAHLDRYIVIISENQAGKPKYKDISPNRSRQAHSYCCYLSTRCVLKNTHFWERKMSPSADPGSKMCPIQPPTRCLRFQSLAHPMPPLQK